MKNSDRAKIDWKMMAFRQIFHKFFIFDKNNRLNINEREIG